MVRAGNSRAMHVEDHWVKQETAGQRNSTLLRSHEVDSTLEFSVELRV